MTRSWRGSAVTSITASITASISAVNFDGTDYCSLHYHAQIFDTGDDAVLNGLTVQLSLSNVPRRPSRDRKADERCRANVIRRTTWRRILPVTLAITGFAIQSIVLMGAAAIAPDAAAATAPHNTTSSADTTSSESPTPTPRTTVAPGANFSFNAPAFSPTNAVRLTGTKDAGSSVVITPRTPGGIPFCTIPASDDTDFGCTAAVASGAAITLTAVQTSDGVASAPVTAAIDVLGAPTINGPPDSLTTGLISGYGFAGSTVTTVLDGGMTGCSSVASEGGYWSCPLAVPSGPYVVRAKQSRADLGSGAWSSLSGSLSVVVDRDAPSSAVITSPTAGSRVTGTEVTISGTGETATRGLAGIADLYLDNTPACQSSIVDGAFSCGVGGVARGTHTLRVIQRDAAGNYSTPSLPITVYFGLKGGSLAPTSPIVPASPAPQATPGAPPSTGPPSETPPPHASAPPVPPGGSKNDWGTPTAFGATLPTLSSSVSTDNLLLAPLLALAFVVLVALPLRLLAGALRGRIRMPSMRFTGRNRSRTTDSPAATAPRPLNPWLAGAIPLAAAAGLILVAGGVDDQVRYLRLSIAVVIGLGVLNVVGVAIATRLGSTSQRVSGRLRFVPLLLLAALLAAVLSRAIGIHPPVIAGVLIGVGFTHTIGARARAIVNLVEIGSVTALAAGAWLLHGLFGSAEGFWALLAAESLATIALAGLGSVVVLVLPIATLPGRAVFEWSRPAWLATVTVAALFASVVILGGGAASFPMVGAILAASAFAALSVAVWGWLRFVDPAAAVDLASVEHRA